MTMKPTYNAMLLLAGLSFFAGCESDTDTDTGAASAGTGAGGSGSSGDGSGGDGSGGTNTGGGDTGGAAGATGGEGGSTAGGGGEGGNAAGNGGAGGGEQQDDFGPDAAATIEIVSGDISNCLADYLVGGGTGAYSGFAGSSDGAYFIWKDAWEGSTTNLRIETWDAFGGVTGPGTYTIKAADTNYADCGVCIFSETAEDGEFWPQAGDTVEFTSLTTGPDGIGKAFAGTFVGTLSNGECSGMVEITFSATARDIGYGPL